MKRVLAPALATAALLAGCGAEEHTDLKEELAQATKDFRGRVDDPARVVHAVGEVWDTERD